MKVSFLINEPTEQPLNIDNVPLQVVSSAKILGVHVNADLKWTLQKLHGHPLLNTKSAQCTVHIFYTRVSIGTSETTPYYTHLVVSYSF